MCATFARQPSWQRLVRGGLVFVGRGKSTAAGKSKRATTPLNIFVALSETVRHVDSWNEGAMFLATGLVELLLRLLARLTDFCIFQSRIHSLLGLVLREEQKMLKRHLPRIISPSILVYEDNEEEKKARLCARRGRQVRTELI